MLTERDPWSDARERAERRAVDYGVLVLEALDPRAHRLREGIVALADNFAQFGDYLAFGRSCGGCGSRSRRG